MHEGGLSPTFVAVSLADAFLVKVSSVRSALPFPSWLRPWSCFGPTPPLPPWWALQVPPSPEGRTHSSLPCVVRAWLTRPAYHLAYCFKVCIYESSQFPLLNCEFPGIKDYVLFLYLQSLCWAGRSAYGYLKSYRNWRALIFPWGQSQYIGNKMVRPWSESQ